MTLSVSRRQMETMFTGAAAELLQDIRRLRDELHVKEQQLKERTIGLIPEAEEQGVHYEAHILKYIDGLDRLKARYARTIDQLGEKVTDVVNVAEKIRPSRKAKLFRRDMWLEFAAALEPLSGRPSKKIAALLIGPKNQLLAWDLNHLCYGIERDAALYVKDSDGGRGHHLWCAERNLIAQYLGLAAIMPKSGKLADIHAAINRLTHSLIGAALRDENLKGYSLVSSHFPCTHCAEVLAPRDGKGRLATVKEIIALWNRTLEGTLTDPNRRTKKAADILRKARPRMPILRKYVNE